MTWFLIALGGLFAVYGVAMAVLYPAGGFFAIWLVLGAAMLSCGWAQRTGAWDAWPLWLRRGAAGTGIAIACGVGAGVAAIVHGAAQVPPANVDYLIVLGAAINKDGSPMETLRLRLDAAADYMEGNPETLCIVSGGQGDDEPMTEARAMARYLERRRDIPASRILLEKRSTTTEENLRFSRKLVSDADATVAVVTNDFHMSRALRMAEQQGFSQVSGLTAPTNPLYLPQATLRECLALAKALVTGRA